MIIAGLVVFTIVIAILAYNLHHGLDRGENTLRNERESARIAPVGAVATDAITSSGKATAEAPVVVQTVIEKPPIDAEALYKSVCFMACETDRLI